MALERKKSDCSHNASECFLQKRSSRYSLESRTCGCDDLEKLRYELEKETINRNEAQKRYSELNSQVEAFECSVEEIKRCPQSKLDFLINKQNNANDTMILQINEAHEKLSSLTHSLKSIQICGKECQLTSKDLIVNYDCMTKIELTKEIKRFERMVVDLRSNLDRLQFKLDCEGKEYYSLLDSFQKLQLELCYLQNLNDKHAIKQMF